ncbi:MAG TPA: hypothetical protein VH253_16830 [Phycisphaerae bacterium]|nr:hypothetical protein [Phycisphaerae bacterium]
MARITWVAVQVLPLAMVAMLVLSQFAVWQLSLGRAYVGVSCFGPFAGWTSRNGVASFHVLPVVRQLSFSTFFTGVHWLSGSGVRTVMIPWWMVLLGVAGCLGVLRWRSGAAGGGGGRGGRFPVGAGS